MKNYTPLIIIIILGLPLFAFLFLKYFSTSVYRKIPYLYEVVNGDTLIYQIPNFKLNQVDGSQLSDTDLKGNISIISFFDKDYRLGTLVLNGNLDRVYKNVKDADFIKMVSIGLDSASVSLYADSLNVDSDIWTFTTGDTSEVVKLAHSIGLKDFEKNLFDSDVSGSNVVVVADKEGKVRYHFIGTDLADIKTLNEELRALIVLEYPEEIGKKP